MTRKILIAMDDSENAMRAVEYVAKSFKDDHQITLFNVVLDTPVICDMNSPSLTPLFVSQRDTFCSIEDQKKSLVNEALKKAKSLLIEKGFQEENLELKVVENKKGAAKGILEEASKGYDTIVMGRRGVSGIMDFFLGSISQKVLQSAGDISIVLVD